VTRRSPFGRLMEGLLRAPHDYRPSIEVFPNLDVGKVAEELELEDRGRQRAGSRGDGRKASGPDDIETEIWERIERENKHAHDIVQDELRTHDERLAGLDIAGRLSGIELAAPACVADIHAEVAIGKDQLHELRRGLVGHERDLAGFRQDHKLKRMALAHSPAVMFLKWAFIALLWAVESVLNGNFLAHASELGIVGGVTEAVGFATLNVGGAVLFSTIGARQLNRRSTFRVFIGAVSIAAWITFTVLLNLALAHYREVAGTLVDQGGQQVMRRLAEAPLTLSDIQSWVLFGIGIFFAIAAFIDGLFLFDPYPGYGAVQKRVNRAHKTYRTRKAALINLLRDICDAYREDIDELSHDIAVRRTEYDAIIKHRGRMVQLFDANQTQLERAGKALFAKCHRAKGAPASGNSFSLDRIEVKANPPNEAEREEIKEASKTAQKLLGEQNKLIHEEFNKAIVQYQQIDDFIPEDLDGPHSPKAS